MTRWLLSVMTIALVGLLFTTQGQVEEKGAPAPARKIPGLTSDDPFPRGCVDCHLSDPAKQMPTRISTLMKQWYSAVEPKLLAKVQASTPGSVPVRGKHPKVDATLKDIPAACLKCHATGSKIAPPLAHMLHAIHFSGGEENHYLTLFQGECTYCHKLNSTTGAWSMPSGPER